MKSRQILSTLRYVLGFCTILSPFKVVAQTYIVPCNSIAVVGTLTVAQNYNTYYVGAGDSLIVTGPTPAIYVDSGGYLDYSVSGGPEIYAANGSTVKLNPNVYLILLWRDSFANIIGMGNIYQDSIVSPMTFSLPSIFNSNLSDFTQNLQKKCSGPGFIFNANFCAYNTSIQSHFGDGTINTTYFTSTNTAAEAQISHVYLNYGTYNIKQVLMHDGVPVDSQTLNYNHQNCAIMSVQFYNDLNGNCIYDQGVDLTGFLPIKVEVDSMNVPVDSLSCTSGFLFTAFGNLSDIFKFKVISLPGDLTVTCPVTGFITDTLLQGIRPTRYIGLSCPTGSSTFDLSLYVDSRAGSHAFRSFITPVNAACSVQNAVLTMQYDLAYTQFSADPAPVSQTPGTAVWNINGLSAVGSPEEIYVHLDGAQWPTGTPVTTTYHITPVNGDQVPGNNSVIVIDTVKGGWDPNAIYAKPSGCVPPGTELEYTITFENLGNGPAENIYVLDTLPAGLDPSTMKLEFASHSMFVEKIYNGSEVVFKFDFPNIMLPDSTSPDRHGMLVYKIKTLNNYPIGSSIDHSASIYFDYNPPVVTNTASTGMCWPATVNNVSSNQANILIYPNPATDELTIQTDEQFQSYTISNSLGQQVLKSDMVKKESRVDIKHLPPGLYYLNLAGEASTEVRKFVKM